MGTPTTVLFKFRPDVSESQKAAFVRELKTLRHLPCVLNQRLIVGGPSITDPIERSKGYHFALLSFHRDRAALEEYQASDEHHREDVTRFDFEVDAEDEPMCEWLATSVLKSGMGAGVAPA
ncbi:hypothetical protein PCL_02542 [Purpureocillium lilacinum]|uniref:Stress-response A/B barrel domain-containing protein n=1 Tax=Purpureocillium lilacinum TaxID=33203 RepID=A0A2U3E0U7_PURLI|nr:hypothetical protein PCL_02542 [Purpureocillium lilacinum]